MKARRGMERCATCCHFKAIKDDPDLMGECAKMQMGENFNPVTYNHERIPGVLAYLPYELTRDWSGTLVCAPDFGCVLHDPLKTFAEFVGDQLQEHVK